MTASADEPRLSWRVHPAAERPGLTAIVVLLLFGVSALAALWMHGVYWGVFALLVLLLSLESYFLPTRYRLDGRGVGVGKVFSQVERPWSAFRGAWFDRLGVTLSPFGRRNWLEPYRALRLRWGPPDASPGRDEVIAHLLAHLDPSRVRMEGLGQAGRETGPGADGAPPGADEG